MFETMCNTIKKNNLISEGDRIVIGLSGGPDSLAMTHALIRMKPLLNLELIAVHINHQFRGTLADSDEAFVIEFCKDNAIECYTYQIDVLSLSKKLGVSFEEAGRIVRYEKFEFVKHQVNANKIAIAQNKNDVIETFFINLFRGSGIDGLASIEYKRDGYFIRPILDVGRSDIEQYCLDNFLIPCRDHTNDENDYLRNKIRNEFLPYIRQEFNASIDDTLQKTIHIMKTEKLFWNEHQKKLFEKHCRLDNNQVTIEIDLFASLQDAEKYQLIRYCIKELRGSLTNLTFDTIYRVTQLTRTGAICKIDASLSIRKQYNKLVLYKEDEDAIILERKLITKMIKVNELDRFELSKYCVAIDVDTVKGQIEVRKRQNGDKFIPFGMSGHKKIKDFFIDEKIPASERDQISLVCDEEKIIWVQNMRIHDLCKITQNTKNIMLMSFQELVECD